MKWLEFLVTVAPEAWRLGRDAWVMAGRNGAKAKVVVTRLRSGMAEDRQVRDAEAYARFDGEI